MFNYSREAQLNLIKKNPSNVHLIKILHNDTLEYIAEHYPFYIEKTHILTEKMMLLSISKTAKNFANISNPTDKVIRKALKKYPDNLKFVKNKTPEFIKLALKLDGRVIRFVEVQTEEYQKIAIYSTSWCISGIKNIHSNLQNLYDAVSDRKYKKEWHNEIKNLIEHNQYSATIFASLPISLLLSVAESTKIKLSFEDYDCIFAYKIYFYI